MHYDEQRERTRFAGDLRCIYTFVVWRGETTVVYLKKSRRIKVDELRWYKITHEKRLTTHANACGPDEARLLVPLLLTVSQDMMSVCSSCDAGNPLSRKIGTN